MSLNDPRRLRVPTPPQGEEIATFGTYLEAQKAVDVLADGAFAVQAVTIVGSDLQMVERVTGRLSYPRVALAGALSGMWFGLFVGLLFSMFNENGLAVIITCAAIGAAFGMLFGVTSYAFTGGKRDFVSQSQVVASRYAVLCHAELAGDARNRLQQAGIQTSRGGTAAAPSAPVAPGGWGQQTVADVPVRPDAPARPVDPAPLDPPRYGQRLDDPPQQ